MSLTLFNILSAARRYRPVSPHNLQFDIHLLMVTLLLVEKERDKKEKKTS